MDPMILYAATALAACHVLRKKREKKKQNAGGLQMQMDPMILYAATALAACHVFKKEEGKEEAKCGRTAGWC
jgi:tryptophan-rich sensory protein